MRRTLDDDALEAAILGGLVLSAGGSGRSAVAPNREIGRIAIGYGTVELVSINELGDDDPIIVATAVGAPGFAKAVVAPRDSIEAARALIAASGRPPAGVIPGHVPGFYAWLQASVLGVPLIDAAGNGRGHPTVKMGGMGLTPDMPIWQAGCGGGSGGGRIEVVVRGNIARTSNVMRAAAVQNGGKVFAARGPLPTGFVRGNGALGAISSQIALGQAMRAEGEDRIRAAVEVMRGRLLVTGEVSENSVAYGGGFDAGQVTVRGPEGELTLGVYNEYMCADLDGRRVATFPDLMATFDAGDGHPVAISELRPGSRIAVMAVSKREIPLGASVFDPEVYPEVEEKMGMPLARYALDRSA